jgi:ankyrin repeat protein
MAAPDFAWFFGASTNPPASPSALYSAASSGSAEQLADAISSGSSDTRVNGWLAVHAAAAKGHAKCVELLVKAQGGAALLSRTAAGELALHLCAKHGHLECLTFLLGRDDSSASSDDRTLVDTPDEKGYSPLHHASYGGHLDTVQWLIESGKANSKAATSEGMTPLLVAAAKGEVAVFDYLTSVDGGALATVQSVGGANALHKAAAAGHLPIVVTMLALKTPDGQPLLDVNAKTMHGTTALHFASSGGHVGVLQALVTGGADAHALTPVGQNGLHKACFEGHVGAVETLLDFGVDPACSDSKGYTPLHCAASGGQHRIVDRFCNGTGQLVDVCARLPSGEDAAILAANNGFQDLASKLTRLMFIKLRTESHIAAMRGVHVPVGV